MFGVAWDYYSSKLKGKQYKQTTTAESYKTEMKIIANPSLAPGGYSQKNWVGVCGPLPKTHTLFMTKICDIPYPIYDLTKNSKPYLWPDSYLKTLFLTSVISSLILTSVKLP